MISSSVMGFVTMVKANPLKMNIPIAFNTFLRLTSSSDNVCILVFNVTPHIIKHYHLYGLLE
jgi:hypothetical protein